MIARGDLASARLESLKDRGEITHVVPNLSAAEKKISRLEKRMFTKKQLVMKAKLIWETIAISSLQMLSSKLII